MDAVKRCEVDQPGLFLARDGPGPDSHLLSDPFEKLFPVARFAYGRGCDRSDFLDALDRRQTAVGLEDGQRLRHGLLGENSGRWCARPEPDHLRLAVHDAKASRCVDLHDDHVDGIAADVDGGDPHACRSLGSMLGSRLRDTRFARVFRCVLS